MNEPRTWTAEIFCDEGWCEVNLAGVPDLQLDTIKAALSQCRRLERDGLNPVFNTIKTTKAHGTVPCRGYRVVAHRGIGHSGLKAEFTGRPYTS